MVTVEEAIQRVIDTYRQIRERAPEVWSKWARDWLTGKDHTLEGTDRAWRACEDTRQAVISLRLEGWQGRPTAEKLALVQLWYAAAMAAYAARESLISEKDAESFARAVIRQTEAALEYLQPPRSCSNCVDRSGCLISVETLGPCPDWKKEG